MYTYLMRYIFIAGPVSVQEPFLDCFGVSLGSTASRGWGSLDHLAMPPGCMTLKHSVPGSVHRVGGTREDTTRHFLGRFQQGPYSQDKESEAWGAAAISWALLALTHSCSSWLGRFTSTHLTSRETEAQRAKVSNFKITRKGLRM